MKFFESPYYQQEVSDLEYLQEKVEELHLLMNHTSGKSLESQIELQVEFLHSLYAMVEKEQCLLVRLQLDGTEEAKGVINELYTKALEAGMAPHHTLSSYHMELKQNIKIELKQITGEDLDDPVEM